MGRWYKGEVVLENDRLWKLTPNSNYWVSENGDIVNANTGYMIKPTVSESGYVLVGKQITGDVGLHRVVFRVFVGAIPADMQINHVDGNKQNNHITNLEICTASENTAHAYTTGLASGKKGSSNSMAKLTEDQVLKVYDAIRIGLTNDQLAEMAGVHPRYISLIRHGKRWQSLFESQGMTAINSVGNLPFSLSKSIHIYNKCILSDKTQGKLAEELGIDPSTVSRIRTGASWKRLRQFYDLPENTKDWRITKADLEINLNV